MNLGLTKNITFSQTRGLSIQILASNLFNDVQFASIDTNVNSPTFGQVTSVRPMRRVQLSDEVQVLMTTKMEPRERCEKTFFSRSLRPFDRDPARVFVRRRARRRPPSLARCFAPAPSSSSSTSSCATRAAPSSAA